ncbi:hemolysin family protein [Parvularcula sp. IMCC14364]|uniref:hemolysin family protein n=1 Tax=Parvularcula sp. IMCC14364 TaxID=3067902 RepID=UPI0027429DB7|nr:hemolysin family protein [Parvularcula sp. IMCC14364]
MADGARPNGTTTELDVENTDDDIQENLTTVERAPGVMSKLRGLLSNGSHANGLVTDTRNGTDAVTDSRREMIERVIAFDSKQVVDVMIPRADIISVEENILLNDLLRVFSEAGHSRLPVFRGDLDDPIGIVHIRDLVGILADPKPNASSTSQPILEKLVRKLLYVPPSMPITDLLLRMQANRIHMALVIDEFGGTDGLVTIEDLVEEIVGDIQDEHDEEGASFLKSLSANVWEANARLPMQELEEAIGITVKIDGDEVDTLGGLVFSLAGRVPLRGEVLRHEAGIEFEVLEADPRRIRKIKFRKLTADEIARLAEPTSVSEEILSDR